MFFILQLFNKTLVEFFTHKNGIENKHIVLSAHKKYCLRTRKS